jgi:hypothetical protein
MENIQLTEVLDSGTAPTLLNGMMFTRSWGEIVWSRDCVMFFAAPR